MLAHLTLNVPDYYGEMDPARNGAEMADYSSKRLEDSPPRGGQRCARLRELVKNQRLG